MICLVFRLFGYVKVPQEAVQLCVELRSRIHDTEAQRGLAALEQFLRSGRL